MDDRAYESAALPDRPTVTVAVVTYNRARLLDSMLESMTHLDVAPTLQWELLIVDNNCTDDTKTVCASYQDRLPIRVVEERVAGVSHARNCALRSARGVYLLFTDDDVRVPHNWLAALLDSVERHPEAAAFGGPIDPDFPFAPDPELAAAFPSLKKGFCGLDYERAEGELPGELGIWTANTAYRLEAIGGLYFDPNLGSSPTRLRCGEEEVFLNELRGRGGIVIWVPAMRVKHYVDPSRMTLKYLVSFQIGKGEEYVHQKHPNLSGHAIGDVPIWLMRLLVQSYAEYFVAQLFSPRLEQLRALKQCCHYRGMIRACRELRQEARTLTAAQSHS